ncbi:hypothetical protein N4G70_12610 [Streptomyces sp. ASQP_92]|uniref:hypothetical protein n=1 Tax=Streptomyces sp. ASQP_92 TaxID=2979116 RepID=UPI0021C1F17C|nr:hypothetical protein [Streptomyces sp. ASQP_92]MCT9089709.1 hypothetical protein [Streptomyces sp. ASQP_92]
MRATSCSSGTYRVLVDSLAANGSMVAVLIRGMAEPTCVHVGLACVHTALDTEVDTYPAPARPMEAVEAPESVVSTNSGRPPPR